MSAESPSRRFFLEKVQCFNEVLLATSDEKLIDEIRTDILYDYRQLFTSATTCRESGVEAHGSQSGKSTDTFVVFICYAHSDNESDDPKKRWLNRLLEHLAPLVRSGKVLHWSDKDIQMGQHWDAQIKAVLREVKAAVLLISATFLASRYIHDVELPRLLMSAQKDGLAVIPILLRPCSFEDSKFKYPDPHDGPNEISLASFQAANDPGKCLESLEHYEQDEVLCRVAKRLAEQADAS